VIIDGSRTQHRINREFTLRNADQMGHPLKVASVITLVPNARSGASPVGQARGSVAKGGASLLSLAAEPSGEGPYVDALREWIERVTPRPSARPALFLVR
jgi:hypothetical protein